MNKVFFGDALMSLRQMHNDGIRVQMCVTSPPYFGLRSYLPDGHPDKALEIGLEDTPDQYIARMVEVFRAVRDVLADDGVLFINIGDSYCSTDKWGGGKGGNTGKQTVAADGTVPSWAVRQKTLAMPGVKPKDLIGIPWLLAFALRADGWYLRQEIIWSKGNAMPESVTDRCTKSHESVFLLAKSARYYFDADAIKEPLAESSKSRLAQDIDGQAGSDRVPGKTNGRMKAVGPRFGGDKYGDDQSEESRTKSGNEWTGGDGKANKRSVWNIATTPYSGAHFAVMPTKLVEPCILAGSKVGDIVLDPFYGSGTVGEVAQNLGRRYIGCELNRAYEPLQMQRTRQPSFMFAEGA